MECLEIIKRYDTLQTDRKVVEDNWDTIERFIIPFTGQMFQTQNTEGEMDWRRREIYDSTAVMAAQTLASSLHGSLTSPNTPWFGLQFSDKALRDDVEAAGWLDECERRCTAEIQASNFNLEVNDLYLMLVSVGTAAITHEPKAEEGMPWEGFEFANIVIRNVFFEEDYTGNPINFYRRIQWTPIQIVNRFGKENVPQCILDKCDNAEQAIERLHLVFCIYKRDDYEEGNVVHPTKRQWGYKYVYVDTKEQVGEEGGYYEQPVYVPRYKRTSGSMWGHGPGTIALPDILTLNQLVQMILKAAEKAIDPPTITKERNLLSNVNLEAGGMTTCRDPDKLIPFESRARFDVSQLQREQLTASIRSAFHVDELELKESPAMTATEVQVRYELMQRLLGPTLGQLQTDFLTPLVERTFQMMLRAGQLPDIPQSVLEADPNIKVNYIGPLARSQKLDDVQATERWLAMVLQMSEVRPEVLDIPDFDQIVRNAADMLSVPAINMKSKGNVEIERQQRQQMQQRMAELEQANMAGEAMTSIGEGAGKLQAVQGAGGAA